MTDRTANDGTSFFGRLFARFRGAPANLPPSPDHDVAPDCINRPTEGYRSFPAPGLGDTVMVGTMRSPHDLRAKLFADNEVLKIHRSHHDWLFKSGDVAQLPREFFPGSERRPGAYRYVPSGRRPYTCIVYRDVETGDDGVKVRHLVPQLAMRSCGYAAGMMIGLDALAARGKDALVGAALGNGVSDGSLSTAHDIAELLENDLAKHGLQPEIVQLGRRSAGEIANFARRYGSLMVSIGGEIGGHFVVLDSAITHRGDPAGAFRVRDPYHGWDVTITAEALLARQPERHILVITEANYRAPGE